MPLYRSLFVSGLFFVLTACSFSKNKNTKEESPGSPAPPIVIQAPETTKKIDTLFDAIDKLDGSAFDKLLTPMNFQQVNSYNSSGETPLYYAVKLNRFIFVKKLLEKGAMPLKLNSDGVSGPLQIGHDVNESIGELLDKKVEELEAQLKQMLNAQRWVEAGEFAEKTFQSKHGFFQDMVVKSLDPKKQSRDQLESDYRWQFVMSELEGGFLSNQSAYLLYKMSAVWGDAQLATAVVEKKLALFESDQSFIFENLRLNTSESWFLFTVSLSRSKNFLMENWYFHEGALRILNTNKFSIEKILELISSGISLKKGENYAVGSAIIRGLASNRSFVSNREATLKIIKEIKAQEAGELFPESFVFQTIEYYAGLAYLDASTLAVFLKDLNYFIGGTKSQISQVQIYQEIVAKLNVDSKEKLLVTYIGSLEHLEKSLIEAAVLGVNPHRKLLLKYLPKSKVAGISALFFKKIESYTANLFEASEVDANINEIKKVLAEVEFFSLREEKSFVTDMFCLYLKYRYYIDNEAAEKFSKFLYSEMSSQFVKASIEKREDQEENIPRYIGSEIKRLARGMDRTESRISLILSLGSKNIKEYMFASGETIYLDRYFLEASTVGLTDQLRAAEKMPVSVGFSSVLDLMNMGIEIGRERKFRDVPFGPQKKYTDVYSYAQLESSPFFRAVLRGALKKHRESIELTAEEYFSIYFNTPILLDKFCWGHRVKYPMDSAFARGRCLSAPDWEKIASHMGKATGVTRPIPNDSSVSEGLFRNGILNSSVLKFWLVKDSVPTEFAGLSPEQQFEYLNNSFNLKGNTDLKSRFASIIQANLLYMQDLSQNPGAKDVEDLKWRIPRYEKLLNAFTHEDAAK